MEAPIILREGSYTEEDVFNLKKDAVTDKDLTKLQLTELFEIKNPEVVLESDSSEASAAFIKNTLKKGDLYGDWVFFPWSKLLVHVVPENDYKNILTARNKEIITEEEQQKLRDTTVSFAGLSVGSGVAINLVHMGACDTMKLADFDTLDTSNLNRVKAGIPELGEKKMNILSRELFEVNPYLSIQAFEEGVNEKNIENFVSGEPKTNVIFEIIDDFKMKVRLRIKAKELGTALIMLTNLGDSILVDVERHDIDKNTEIFNGKIGNVGEQILAGEVSKEDEKKYAIGIVGMDNIPERVLSSVKQIGKTLVGRPQLASTVAISSGIGAYFVKRIALGEDLPSGRTLIKFEDF